MNILSKITICLIIALQCIVAPQMAQSPKDKLSDALKQNGAQMSHMECQFSVVHKVKMLKDLQKEDGQLIYDKAANSLSLISSSPSGTSIVMTSQTFSSTTNGRTSTTKISRNPSMQQLKALIDACFSGDLTSAEKGGILTVEENSDYMSLHFVPNDARARQYVASIDMTFDKKTYAMSTLKISQASEEYFLYTFY